MKESDPPPKQQKAANHSIPIYLIENCTENSLFFTIGILSLAALFFACRSCEYSKVNGERKTKLLQVQDICFRQGHSLLKSHSYNILSTATSVSLTFRDQKNNERFETITQHRSTHKTLCPVKLWARIISKIRSIPGSSDLSPVCFYYDTQTSKTSLISSTQILQALRWAVIQIGEDILGFKSSDIGTHSIRSGGAMAMYLSGIPIVTIMLIGRWKSDAFVKYIRKQVLEFTAGVSEKMSQLGDFYTLPDNIQHQLYPSSNNNADIHGDQLQNELSSLLEAFNVLQL